MDSYAVLHAFSLGLVLLAGLVMIAVVYAIGRDVYRSRRRLEPAEDLAQQIARDSGYRKHAKKTGHLLSPLSACETCRERAVEIMVVETVQPFVAYVLRHHPENVTTNAQGHVAVTCPGCSVVSTPWHPSSRGADAHRFDCTIDTDMERAALDSADEPGDELPYPVTRTCDLCDEPITMSRGDDPIRHAECVTKHVDEQTSSMRDDLITFAQEASDEDLALRLIDAFDTTDYESSLLAVAAYRLVHDPSDERRAAFARALEAYPDAPLRSLLETSNARRALMTADLLRMFDADAPAIRDELKNKSNRRTITS